MFGTIKGRILIVLAVTAISLIVLFTQGIKLGLDLKGGLYVAMEVDDPTGTMSDDVKSDAIDQNLPILRNRIDKYGVAEPLVQKAGDDRIILQLPGVRDPERAKEVIQKPAVLEFRLVHHDDDVVAAFPRIDRAVSAAIAAGGKAAEAVPAAEQDANDTTKARRERVQDLLFGAQDSLRAAGDSASGDSASALTPTDRPFSSRVLPYGAGQFLVAMEDVPTVARFLTDSIFPTTKAALPRGVDLFWGTDTVAQGTDLYQSLYALEDKPFLKGDDLEKATPGKDAQYNRTIVSFELSNRGGRIFDNVTGANIGNRIAVVLDDQVFSAPQVNGRIGRTGQIEMGQAPMTEAQDLALVLNAGAFTAPLRFMEQREVEASLGGDSIRQGMVAGILGLLIVIAIMIGVYRLAGVLAVIALVVYCIVVLGGLAGIRATLTAPGIAGFILSIGMAVDSNVLIFERIREELLAGRSVRLSIDEGFKHAMSAIIDTHLTTLITALILYRFGTGPIQGFAVTLSIGLVASFFSAVFVTRTLFMIYMDRRRGAETISI
jgi:preprotein translocase subunit SecD